MNFLMELCEFTATLSAGVVAWQITRAAASASDASGALSLLMLAALILFGIGSLIWRDA